MRASLITGRLALAWCCLSVALLVAACGSSGTPAPAKTVTVTVTPPIPPTSATPTSTGPLPCPTTGLRLAVGAENGAAGTVYYPLDFANTSASACTMYGYPGVAFVSSPGGRQVGAPAGRSGGATGALVTVPPGATAHATLAVSDVRIGDNCRYQVPVHWVQVYPPGQYSALYAPLSREGCADRSLVTMTVTKVGSGP